MITMYKKPIAAVLLLLLLLFTATTTYAQDRVNLYLFYSTTCPHCANERQFLDIIEDEYPYLTIHEYETGKNRQLFKKIADELEIERFGYVPTTFIGNDYLVGYRDDEITGQQIRELIEKYHQQGDPDIIGKIILGQPFQISPTAGEAQQNSTEKRQQVVPENIRIPLFGKINTKQLSLPALTFILALADGFNPCAMWVLLFLISILLTMESKKRAYVLGVVFIATSGLVYFLFLTAWLNLFLTIGLIFWIRMAVGVFALAAGSYQLIEFCRQRDSGCIATEGERRRKIFDNIKKVARQKNIMIALVGMIILAVAVNIVELICSLGLPALYTQVLSLTPMSPLKYYSYLAFYVLIFMIDDLIVFFIAMITLHQTAIQSKYARYSKLLGGVIILILGLLLLFKPELLIFG